jgi:predicted RNA-binding protein with PIN domain
MSLNEKNDTILHLVDGHNLLHFSSKLKKLYKINPHLSLQELVTNLVSWASVQPKIELVIYLDGKNAVKFSIPKQVKLFQSGIDKTADDLILSHAQKWAKKKVVVVHTQDRELQKKLRLKSIFTSDNKELAATLFKEVKQSKAANKSVSTTAEIDLSNRGASAQEVDEMLLYYHLRDMDSDKKSSKK